MHTIAAPFLPDVSLALSHLATNLLPAIVRLVCPVARRLPLSSRNVTFQGRIRPEIQGASGVDAAPRHNAGDACGRELPDTVVPAMGQVILTDMSLKETKLVPALQLFFQQILCPLNFPSMQGG